MLKIKTLEDAKRKFPNIFSILCSAFKLRKGYLNNEECLVHNGRALQFHDHNKILPKGSREKK